MKRNWYAVVILLMLCLLLLAAGRYVDRTTEALVQQVQAAYALAMQGDCPAARRAYGRAAEKGTGKQRSFKPAGAPQYP